MSAADYGELRAVASVTLDGGGGLASRADRAERRRQVDAVPPDLRDGASDLRADPLLRRRRHAQGGAPPDAARHGPHVPALEPLRRPVRARERRGRGAAEARHRSQRRAAGRPFPRRRGALGGAARASRPRRPRRRRGRLAVVRAPAPARDRARARHGAAPAAPRRADRGDVARRGAAVPGPDRRIAGRAHADDRRARHGRRLRAGDGDLGARRRPADRERPAGGDPRARPSYRRRTSARATGWRSCSPA